MELTPRPIEPSWIIEGKPEAKACTISQSADRTAFTVVWHCTGGKFNWYYEVDETIHILEGSIVLENDSMAPRRYGPGDVILFKAGAHAIWQVEGHVKKLAFFRRTQPAWLSFALRATAKIKRTLRPSGRRQSANLMGAG